MPVIDFQSPLQHPPVGLFLSVVEELSVALSLPEDRVWILWHSIPVENYFKKSWVESDGAYGPIIRVRCKIEYNSAQRRQIIEILVRQTSIYCEVDSSLIYVVLDPVQRDCLYVRGKLWT